MRYHVQSPDSRRGMTWLESDVSVFSDTDFCIKHAV